MTEPIPGLLMVGLRQIEQAGQLPPEPVVVLFPEPLELRFGKQFEVSQPIQDCDSTDLEVVSDLDNVVDLELLAARFASSLDLHRRGLVVNLGDPAARSALAQALHELPHAGVGHQESRREGIRADLDQIVPVRCPAHHSEAISVD